MEDKKEERRLTDRERQRDKERDLILIFCSSVLIKDILHNRIIQGTTFYVLYKINGLYGIKYRLLPHVI
jgi:hypothetical protein